jgi:2'-5' RNA ligase
MNRYTICHLVSNRELDQGDTFSSLDWPLHVTIAGSFETPISVDEIIEGLANIAKSTHNFTITFGDIAYLGPKNDTEVTLVDNNKDLLILLGKITTFLTSIGTIFRNPSFYSVEGFVPHATVQSNERKNTGESTHLDSFSLVQHEPDGVLHERILLKTFLFTQ